MLNSVVRRSVLKGMTAAGAIAASGTWSRGFAADELVVGALYVGPKTDFGWNQAHAEGIAVLREIESVTVVEEERVPETVEV